MKKMIALATLMAMAGTASAQLSFDTTEVAKRTEAFNLPWATYAIGTKVKLGELHADVAGTITFTYLGQESGYLDGLKLNVNGSFLTESKPIGSSISSFVNAGAVDFKFYDNMGGVAQNIDSNWSKGTSIGLIGKDMKVAGHSYSYVLGFDDSAGRTKLGDWDDFVVGVNLAPVPEPETYALMLAGLGVVGFVARRRRQQP
jgi:hypothetical protein